MANVYVAEPRLDWAQRPKLVIDASLVAAAAFGEPERDQALAQMRGRALCAPALIDYEVANVALSKIRCKAVSADEARRALGVFREFAIDRREVDPGALIGIGETFGLTAYDAAYLWVAGELRAPIATFDSRVAAAAAAYLTQLPPPS
jgi:predicted nucleic acid-binding protein